MTVSGEFGKEGEPASNICYKTALQSDAPHNEIAELIKYVDKIQKYITLCEKG